VITTSVAEEMLVVELAQKAQVVTITKSLPAHPAEVSMLAAEISSEKVKYILSSATPAHPSSYLAQITTGQVLSVVAVKLHSLNALLVALSASVELLTILVFGVALVSVIDFSLTNAKIILSFAVQEI
jgi:hypothetical protein